MSRRSSRLWLAAGVIALVSSTWSGATAAPPRVNSATLRRAVTPAGIFEHLEAFQAIADANGGTRAAATPGYVASADYVADRLRDAGYRVREQHFEFNYFEELSPPVLDPTAPDRPAYSTPEDFVSMTYSGTGDVTRPVVATNDVLIPPPPESGSTSGCEPEDFPAAVAGNIALIQRGTCTFEQKAATAQAAGAVGVIIFNEGQEGRTETLAGTLGRPFDIPVVGTSFEVGRELYQLSRAPGGLTVRLATETLNEVRETSNVLADSPWGNARRTVVLGAHLDSVLEGPGINDNGSGTGTLLEIAEELDELDARTRNHIRFAFWGAEEAGLFGSQFYVDSLSARQVRNIEAYLNFDMVGSPNYVRFVFDGNGSDTGIKGPQGSGLIERIFNRFYERHGLETDPTALDGRSDYVAFAAVGIPVGGMFSGAEGIKTEEQAEVYGGQAGVAYDPCYHEACDTIDNVNRRAINQFSNGTAHALWMLATRIHPLP
jgi:Zn-dependent M28 family amino/carboxypeptidase